MRIRQVNTADDRRHFLRSAMSLGAAALIGDSISAIAALPPLEITRVRFDFAPILCLAPQYLAEEVLRLEGFKDIEFVDTGSQIGPDALAAGRIDFSIWDAASSVWAMDREKGFLILAGIHAGCWELVGNERVRAIRELRGRKIAIDAIGYVDHAWISSVLAYVGINPVNSVEWVISASNDRSMRMFIEGRVDAFLATPPRAQELRARRLGNVLVNSSQDRPWSQYFCCMLISSRDYVGRYPAAAKRVTRALLKAAEICANEPERVARFMVTKGFVANYAMALGVLKGLPYSRWRESDPEDTLRFYALRLHEVGMIKTHPNKLIAQSTDWRFMNELRRELKG